MTGFTLEPLTVADREFRLEVYRATIKPYLDDLFDWDEATEASMVVDQLKAGTHAAIVVGGHRVGVVQIGESPEAISLSQIEILPEFQGRGIGTAVVRSLIARCEREGKPLTLHVFKTNTSALRLYERLGFVVTGHGDHDTEMAWTPAPG